jgi:4-hydroxybenzoate polyprenyltransferase
MHNLASNPVYTTRLVPFLRDKHVDQLPLIYSILIVSLSGACKLRFAYEFLGFQIPMSHFIVAALVTYAAYAFDRGVENKEDEKRGERFKKAMIVTAIISLLVSFVLFPNPLLLLPFIIAYLYTRGIGGFRLKGGKGVKNAIVAFTFSLGTIIFVWVFSLPALIVYLFFFCKSFVNTIIYDVRDIEKDRQAGILTIPTLLGTQQLRAFLIGVAAVAHLILIAGWSVGWIAGIDVILLSSVHTILYIIRYSSGFEVLRNTLVDGEWMIYAGYTLLRDVFL